MSLHVAKVSYTDIRMQYIGNIMENHYINMKHINMKCNQIIIYRNIATL